ncbi:MAG: 23S rRNA (uracil(1939)-C(5))-methyltransferase RlmD [Candidatus Melainabacteria bacterium]|nr:23S rRNA (uracil(1939)-C(5))-methyltransferase RlmD [Candidatus Melainabacteria bacterium]
MIEGPIQSIAFGGEGILRHENLVVFVPFTAPGDEAVVQITKQKKNYAQGKLVGLNKKSSDRIEPPCSYFGTCGGCQLQHMNYTAQLGAKKTFILDALKRIGKIDYSDICVQPAHQQWHYRRHIRLKLKNEGKGFIAGYAGADPSVFVPIRECPIFISTEIPLLPRLQFFLSTLSSDGIEEGTLRILKSGKDKFLLAFQFFPFIPTNSALCQQLLGESIQGIVIQAGNTEKKWGDTDCRIEVLGLTARFSPFGFVQVHPEQSQNLYEATLNALPTTSKKILDLYCGIGITSLLFARTGRTVIGVESHPETIQLAQENAKANNITSAQFFEGASEQLGAKLLKQENPDVVLCNPPRTGLDPTLINALLQQKPACILYISCMPATLARDLHLLTQGGYRIDRMEAFDMFPQTTHVETLVRLIL